MKSAVLGLAVVAVAAGSGAACASKGYVNTQVAEVNEKVGQLSTAVEENEERTRQNTTRIGEVDEKVGRVDEKADAATRAAEEAQGAADAVDARADAMEAHSRRLVFEVVISESEGNFKFGDATLPDEAKTELDKMIADIKADPGNVFFEIEGHTDSTGTEQVNDRIGLQRAEAAKKYLYEAHQVPLHKINVISYGETRPVAPNDTQDGRAQNRRIVVRVLS